MSIALSIVASMLLIGVYAVCITAFSFGGNAPSYYLKMRSCGYTRYEAYQLTFEFVQSNNGR
jgi:hypothetical protein